MGSQKTILIITAAVAISALIASGTWFTYQNYMRNHAPVQPTITQEQMDQAAAIMAEQEAKRLEEFRANLPPIKASPKAQEVEPDPDDSYTASGSDIEVERPEFSKPEPPPPPSVSEEEKKDPNSKPQNPEPPKPSKGDTRVTADGRTEKYMGDHFGWVEHSPGGTHENASNAGTGDVIGY